MTSPVTPKQSISGDGASGTITAAAIAELVGGELEGDGGTVVTGVASLDRAEEFHLSILASAKYAPMLAESRAGVVLVDPQLRNAAGSPRARILVSQPLEKLLAVLPRLYVEHRPAAAIASTARIGRHVSLGKDVSVGEHAVLERDVRLGDGAIVGPGCVLGAGASIGAGSRLWPGVTVYPGAVIGERVNIHAGARVGCDGFGYVFRKGAHEKIPHVGGCIIGDDVEIGANTTIDRGSIDDTVIGNGSKIDNLVHVAHNVRIGQRCLIMAQVGIAGSAVIEDDCIIAGQAGLGGHITIGKGARIAGQAGVFGDVPAGESWSGYPARPHRESLRATGALFRLAGMMRSLEKLLDPKTK
ncbi:MAG TPA: UDP-3-O-(3-hydroxymyristoyl)glucosamine N-acyltransferase [Gemmatimonadaceae bacterium]|nr:UDP-3-O-(3-hydroxymyristoyl)glucosamine N-acyltransferase [Gemmatimonadaceae bacterium]